MKETTILKGMFIVACLVSLILAVSFLDRDGELEKYRMESIDKGYAVYCPYNGQLAWIGECGGK